jgi:precorrin-3B synthase
MLIQRQDHCPGALSVHPAADGALARVRLPGGQLSGRQLQVLTELAVELGDGHLELTSRANVQIRALADGAELDLAERVANAGLLPSASHERIRNILASPLSGIDGLGSTDVSELVGELDRLLCARPALAGLPARFLFALDDGRGDLRSTQADVALIASGPDSMMLLVAGVPTLNLTVREALPAALLLAEEFLAEPAAGSAWRINELPDGGAGLRARVGAQFAKSKQVCAAIPVVPLAGVPARPIGRFSQPDGRSAVVLQAPLGRLSASQASLIAAHAGALGLRVTPWHSVVLPGLASKNAEKLLAQAEALGLGVDDQSPWYWISSCTGSPGCAKSRADVQADARRAAEDSDSEQRRASPRQHQAVRFSGCERRCGRPQDTDVDLIATDEGYLRLQNSSLAANPARESQLT